MRISPNPTDTGEARKTIIDILEAAYEDQASIYGPIAFVPGNWNANRIALEPYTAILCKAAAEIMDSPFDAFAAVSGLLHAAIPESLAKRNGRLLVLALSKGAAHMRNKLFRELKAKIDAGPSAAFPYDRVYALRIMPEYENGSVVRATAYMKDIKPALAASLANVTNERRPYA